MSNLTRQDALRLVSEQGLSVNIPYGYQHIERAFFGLGITSVTIPESVTHIWDEAFYGNELVSLTIPSSVKTIGRHAFFNNNLSNVTFEGTPWYIRDYAFADNQIRQICLKKKRKFNCMRNLELKRSNLLEGKRIEIPVIEFKK